MARRRAASSTSSGRTPVGYRNRVGIKSKTSSRSEKRFWSVAVSLRDQRPFSNGAQVHPFITGDDGGGGAKERSQCSSGRESRDARGLCQIPASQGVGGRHH